MQLSLVVDAISRNERIQSICMNIHLILYEFQLDEMRLHHIELYMYITAICNIIEEVDIEAIQKRNIFDTVYHTCQWAKSHEFWNCTKFNESRTMCIFWLICFEKKNLRNKYEHTLAYHLSD